MVGGQASSAPSTRTAPPPEGRFQVEPTPSGVSRTAPPGYLEASTFGAPPHRSKRWIAAAIVVVAGSGVAGWVLTQPTIPTTDPTLAVTVAATVLAAPPPVAPPSSPPLGVVIGGATAAATPAEAAFSGDARLPEGKANLESAPSGKKSTRPRARPLTANYDVLNEQPRAMEVLPEVKPVAKPAPVKPVTASQTAPAPAPPPERKRAPGRGMPGSGIGAGG